MKKLFIIFLLYVQVGCSPDGNSNSINFPIKPLMICPDKNDCTGADIRLSIVHISENDTFKVYKVISSYHNNNLGLLICVPKAKENNQGFGKNIILKSVGKESDELLSLIGTLYGEKPILKSKFAPFVKADYVNLGIFAKAVAGGQDKESLTVDEYKLFFESKDDEAELFLNINPTEKWIDLREKDPEYRKTIIKILSE
jgi:hypothetical protein